MRSATRSDSRLLHDYCLVDEYTARDTLPRGKPCLLVHVKWDVANVVRAAEAPDEVDALISRRISVRG